LVSGPLAGSQSVLRAFDTYGMKVDAAILAVRDAQHALGELARHLGYDLAEMFTAHAWLADLAALADDPEVRHGE
jgi:hypothetical protein